ncbi:hypothetical protein HanXRQr2_Chr14g0656751 [Helianthus annuus]|uniref:Uncharacterized protein n=1 Tax=Helianthus annuus TaxID=4232 RepID=A0A251SJT3_HELAN|nr:hypothetical protein HanXRQr2_Chr14g0656751 [Helianthus annuus]KAJ0469871.1 hypothetical protein HanIR_Chr14g0712641 [Helianthus annuus]
MMTLNDMTRSMRMVRPKSVLETAPLQIVPPIKPSCAPRLATIREERGEGFEDRTKVKYN